MIQKKIVSKDIFINSWETQTREWQKICANHVPNKERIPKIFKRCLLTYQQQSNKHAGSKELNIYSSNDEPMTKKHL